MNATDRPVQPTIETDRLILRPFSLADAVDVYRLAGERDIAATTQNIPHPYPEDLASHWIETHAGDFARGIAAHFAIALRPSDRLCGAIGLVLDTDNNCGELGYWIGKPYWRRGYCTEAALAVVKFGFEVLQLHRIHSSHFAANVASGRVMQKIGMSCEGCLRQHVRKWGTFEDIVLYGIVREDWQN